MELLVMSPRDQLRAERFSQVKQGQITLAKAASLLKLGYRQALRQFARYRRQGAKGLVHGLRGRPSNHRCEASLKRRVIKAYRQHYHDFGPTLAAEELLTRQSLRVSDETLRRWLLAQGLWHQRRRRQKHRQRRQRRTHDGELVQQDGSPHKWLEDRGPMMTLIELVDDATGRAYGRFYPEEDTVSVMDCLRRYIQRHGVPVALYVDKDSIYRVNNPLAREQGRLCGQMPQTQFGRAAKELNIQVICAHSPQAKGRVERVHGTHQDRLVKLLRLEKISTMEAANDYLEKTYWKSYNAKFSRPAAEPVDLHRKLPGQAPLDKILCLKERRKVSSDWCVSYQKKVLQIGKAHQGLSLAGQQIEVIEQLDGKIMLMFKGRVLSHQNVDRRPRQEPARQIASEPRKPWKPKANHPFNAPYGRRAARGPSPAPDSAAPRPAPPKPPSPQMQTM